MRITVVHSGALGDTVLLLPLIRALKIKYAGAHLALVMRPAFGQMFVMWGEVAEWHSIDDAAASRWFAENPDAGPLPWSECDILISAVSDGNDKWAEHARKFSTAKEFYFYNPRPAPNDPRHVTDFQRDQLSALNLPPVPHVHVEHNPDGAIIFHPGSGGEAKCWPRDRFIQLARELKRNGILPTFILGEAEQERWGRETIELLKDEFPWYLHIGLFEVSERMRRARMFLGNDSGVSHIAGAIGIPTLVLFGPSDDVQWRPHGPAVKVLRAASEPKNLDALAVDDVLHAILEELRKL
jgi:heptosyltransferase-3